MGQRVEVLTKGSINFSGTGLVSELPIKVFNIKDDSLTGSEIKEVTNILADPIVEDASVNLASLNWLPENSIVIEQTPKPGVTDPAGEAARGVIQRTLGREVGPVSFSRQYLFKGPLGDDEYIRLTKQLSNDANPVIHEFRRINSADWDPVNGMGFHFPDVNLPKPKVFEYIDLPDDKLLEISEKRCLSLNLEEMRTMKEPFSDEGFIAERRKVGLEDRATDVELEIIGQTWSEHCVHKKLGGRWSYTSDDENDASNLPLVTNNVFKSIIAHSTFEIAKGKDWLVSVFEDNSGVVRLNKNYNIAHKVETHNFPSSLDGFGGANTGTGGVLRDPKGTGVNMTLVSSQWGFRVAHPDSYPDLPLNIQTPLKTLESITSGVEDYGNKMGIPTMCGNVIFDDGFLKPGVVVGAVSVAPAVINGRPSHEKDIQPGYIALTLGGKVGKDGIHGATGSSIALSSDAEEKDQVNQSVQIGNPLVEKGVFEVMNYLHKLDLIEGSQDCGAGGFNSAISELGELLNNLEAKRYEVQQAFSHEGITRNSGNYRINKALDEIPGLDKVASPFVDLIRRESINGAIFDRKSNGKGGVTMDLTHAPEKYKGMMAWEKTISEAQERMIITIKPENLEDILEICKHNNVEAVQIAEFNDSGKYKVIDQDQTVAFLPMDFLHTGLPQMEIEAHYTPCKNKEPNIPTKKDLTKTLLDMLRRPNMQIHDGIMRRFDHEVQGGSLVKPIIGKGEGKSGAIAYHPVLGEDAVAIESLGSNPFQGDIDAYEMGKNNVVDAIGKIIAVGGSLEQITFNGNTLCPRPEIDKTIAAKVIRMLKGSADAEIYFGTPRISGKDSTSMERSYISTETEKEVHVKSKPELIMSALGVIPDNSTLTTADFKLAGDIIYVVGETRDELGASEFYAMNGKVGRNVPKSNFEELKPRYEAMEAVIKEGIVHSAQYLERGGLAAGLANSNIAGDLGSDVSLTQMHNVLTSAQKNLFSETTGRFLVTVSKDNQDKFESMMTKAGQYVSQLGYVDSSSRSKVSDNSNAIINADVTNMRIQNKGDIRI